ncbi:MAG: primase-like DNA-binding domain-containing protein [Pseudomonadota bacterium]
MDREPHSPDLPTLSGEVRIVTVTDPVPGARVDESVIATVTGGEPVTVRAAVADGEFHRRWAPIPWSREEHSMPDELQNVAPSGAIDWSRVRVIAWFDPAPAPAPEAPVIAAKDRVSVENDQLTAFLNDCTVSAADARVQSSALYEAFSSWCQQNERPWWSPVGLSASMASAGYQKITAQGVWWVGLSLAIPKTDGAAENIGPVA